MTYGPGGAARFSRKLEPKGANLTIEPRVDRVGGESTIRKRARECGEVTAGASPATALDISG